MLTTQTLYQVFDSRVSIRRGALRTSYQLEKLRLTATSGSMTGSIAEAAIEVGSMLQSP